MGNAHGKPHPKFRNTKQVHWKAADRPAPPGKPFLLPGSEGTPDLITLRWSHPINDGGSPISGYVVEHRRVGSPHWVRATPLPVPFTEITLSGLEPGWRYQFRVKSENAVGYSDCSEISEPITVTLQRSAITAPQFTQDVRETVALENEKCEFVVHFLGQPPPQICWFKDGFEIFSSRRIRILTEHDRSILTIHQTSLSDEGEIKCTATNRAGHVSSKARLTVEAPPGIRIPRNYEDGLLFEIGEVIRLKVSVVGRPTPLVFWTHNGESIQNGDRYELEYSDKYASLKITGAKRSDRGEYQIRAVNKLGNKDASFLVTVTDKPSPPGKARVVMALGRSVTLAWTTPEDDGGCKIGNYIVEYYRLGWDVWLKAATSRQLTTILGDLIEGSEYKFRVKAESPYGISDPSEESEVVFIPDPKRGLTHPQQRGNSITKDILEDVSNVVAAKRKNKTRSSSSPRTRQPQLPDFNANISESGIPQRPKRTKTKSQPQTPEASPMFQRKKEASQINKTIFDRSSLARDLAYGSPEIKIKKEANTSVSAYNSNIINEVSKSSSPEPKTEKDHAVYKLIIEPPQDTPKEETSKLMDISSLKERNKLIREHSATVSGSSEFMLVLYSDEKDQPDLFNFNDSIPPPLSLSAPELSELEQPQFPVLKSSASSTEILHEKAMMRLYQTVVAEEKELERRRNSNPDPSLNLEIPKIQINSKESNDVVGQDKKHLFKRRMSGGPIAQKQSMWVQKRHSLNSPSEVKDVILPTNLKKAPVSLDMKRGFLLNRESSTSEDNDEQDFEKTKKLYTQASFERKPVSIEEENKWKEEYEESMSETESESESDYERFKAEVSKARKVTNDEGFHEEQETYRPVGGLSGMNIKNNEPFEILSKRKDLPDPNFVPKPILKRSDSPSISPISSPPSSPIKPRATVHLSPTKITRSLSPRPDVVLQRNRSKSLAVPDLSPLISNSSEDEQEDPKQRKSRSFSLTNATKTFMDREKTSSKKIKKALGKPLSNIAKAAQITGMTAASIVIPNRLLNKKKEDDATKVMADHYDSIVKSVEEHKKRSSFDRDSFKKNTCIDAHQENGISSKEQTPSKENLSQDSGYQSVSGHRRSSFTDHYDFRMSPNLSKSPIRKQGTEYGNNPFKISKPQLHEQHTISKPNNTSEYEESKIKPILVTNTQTDILGQGSQYRDGWSIRRNSLTPPIDQLREQTESSAVKEPVRRSSLAVPDPDDFLGSSESKTSNPGRGSSDHGSQGKDVSPGRRGSTIPNQALARRGSATGIQLGNFAHQQKAPSISSSSSGRRSIGRSKSPSKRGTSIPRKAVGISPARVPLKTTDDRQKRPAQLSERRNLNEKSSFPSILNRKPSLREIMTQTSGYLESLNLHSLMPQNDKHRHEELLAQAEFQVRSTVDWLMDLAMFIVACWLYIFSNELLAIPVLLVMVYRQLKEEIRRRIPSWIAKRFKSKKTE